MRFFFKRGFWTWVLVLALLAEGYARMRMDSTDPLHLAPLPAVTRKAVSSELAIELVPGAKVSAALSRRESLRPTAIEYSIGPDGFRGGAITQPKPVDTLRIAVLGDASVFGVGVKEDETFAKVLERELSAALRARKVEVLNCGIPGADLRYEIALCRTRILDFDPDVVLACATELDVVAADPMPWSTESHARWLRRLDLGGDSPSDDLEFVDRGPWILRRISRLVDQIGYGLESHFRDAAWTAILDANFGIVDSPGWTALQARLRAFAADCGRRRAQAHVVFIPSLANLREYAWRDRHKALAELATANGVILHDLLPTLDEHSGEPLIVSIENPYPSVEAHRRIGEFLAKDLASSIVAEH